MPPPPRPPGQHDDRHRGGPLRGRADAGGAGAHADAAGSVCSPTASRRTATSGVTPPSATPLASPPRRRCSRPWGSGLGACGWREIEVARAESGAPSDRAARARPGAGRRTWDPVLAADDDPHPPTGRGHRRRAVIPILTPEEMAAVDAAAPDPVEVLIERAGAAVAHHALVLLQRCLRPPRDRAGRQGEQRSRRAGGRPAAATPRGPGRGDRRQGRPVDPAAGRPRDRRRLRHRLPRGAPRPRGVRRPRAGGRHPERHRRHHR